MMIDDGMDLGLIRRDLNPKYLRRKPNEVLLSISWVTSTSGSRNAREFVPSNRTRKEGESIGRDF